MSPSDVEFDHSPPLGLREYNTDTGLYIPDENDPKHIVLRTKEDHRIKTTGKRGDMGTVVDGDIHKIAKSKRVAKKHEEARMRILAKEPGKSAEKQRKWRWPKKKFTSPQKNS